MSHGEHRKALLVGINDYAQSPLRACENDARAMEKVLRRHEKGDPNFDVVRILNSEEKVTGELLKSRIQDLFKTELEMALFYFSGHGAQTDGKTYLVAADYPNKECAVDLEWIMDIIQDSPAKQVVVILDCCHAGAAADAPEFEYPTAQIRKGVTILAATTPNDVAVEKGGNGKFTKIICRALEGAAIDLVGHVTTASIFAYADGFFSLWEQRPVYKTNVTRLTAVRYCLPKVPKQTLREIPELFKCVEDEFQLNLDFLAGSQGKTANIRQFKMLLALKQAGLVEGSNARTLSNEARKDGACRLTEAGKDVHLLVKKGKI